VKTITVEVTQDDIDHGERGRCQTCPIALALKRATGEAWSVTDVIVYQVGRPEYAWLPARAEGFVHRFDDCEQVKPFTFKLKVSP